MIHRLPGARTAFATARPTINKYSLTYERGSDITVSITVEAADKAFALTKGAEVLDSYGLSGYRLVVCEMLP